MEIAAIEKQQRYIVFSAHLDERVLIGFPSLFADVRRNVSDTWGREETATVKLTVKPRTTIRRTTWVA